MPATSASRKSSPSWNAWRRSRWCAATTTPRTGHSHKPLKEERDGVLYLNPGSAGPRRFSLPIGIGVLEVAGKKIEAELITL